MLTNQENFGPTPTTNDLDQPTIMYTTLPTLNKKERFRNRRPKVLVQFI